MNALRPLKGEVCPFSPQRGKKDAEGGEIIIQHLEGDTVL
jgi:hypothetical protein